MKRAIHFFNKNYEKNDKNEWNKTGMKDYQLWDLKKNQNEILGLQKLI